MQQQQQQLQQQIRASDEIEVAAVAAVVALH